MSKKSVVAVLMMIFSIGVISIYATYAYNNEVISLGESESDYNLIYSISESSNREVLVNKGDTKFVDVELTNTYKNTVKYGMFYYAINPEKLPEGVSISLADTSIDDLESLILKGETKIISLKIENDSEYDVSLIVGALIGFENGDISELETDKQILIK